MEPTVVLFGNSNPQMQVVQDGGGTVSVPADHLNQSVTRVDMSEGFSDQEKVDLALSTENDRMLIAVSRGLDEAHRQYAIGVYECEQIIGVHAAGSKPDWVSSSDPEFQAVLAAHFSCPVGEPVAVLTEKGRDALHEQHLKSTQPAAFKWGALSPSKTSVAAGDTTLAEEITTAGGGLLRAEMTFAHTAGTNTSTLTHTWAANGSDTLPVTIAKWANFNASSVGTMGEEDLLSSAATLSASGDSVTVTFTLTAG